jgi:hypothetical protein
MSWQVVWQMLALEDRTNVAVAAVKVVFTGAVAVVVLLIPTLPRGTPGGVRPLGSASILTVAGPVLEV